MKKLKVYSCCGHDTVVKRVYCPSCGANEISEREVEDKGSIYSFTKIHVPPSEFAHLAPYYVALVQLDGTSAKVTARMTEDIAIGDQVELDKVEDGAYLYKSV
ncbi:hypothetical protein SAMN04488127_0560 [Bhargavaea ginsengi]|uniref:ChsH2 C-terminal OB-fold domain-containing protein n=1 Tax=Bhargavaea ginsengi TaxID=426757 RepID=A0A1H6TRK8_9BACL|nr:OB-fold domain-containing protein [Bhargavaea ginsengi]SEI82678.1 hypothetical protein SAMN04488127_0560 [Bhargavaea ginsengi]